MKKTHLLWFAFVAFLMLGCRSENLTSDDSLTNQQAQQLCRTKIRNPAHHQYLARGNRQFLSAFEKSSVDTREGRNHIRRY